MTEHRKPIGGFFDGVDNSVVICDDDSIWRYEPSSDGFANEWRRLPDIPQDEWPQLPDIPEETK